MDSENKTSIDNIKIEKILSIIFIIIGLTNIYADDLLVKSIKCNDNSLKVKATEIFLFGLIISFILYIIIVSRNYSFYIQKKNTGEDATPELTRLFGSVIILFGFAIVFYYFIKNSFDTEAPPVL